MQNIAVIVVFLIGTLFIFFTIFIVWFSMEILFKMLAKLFNIRSKHQQAIEDSQKYYKIAVEIQKEILDSGAKIDDLSVTFSKDTVVLSGFALSDTDKQIAGEVAKKHQTVNMISNGILVKTS